MYIHIYTHMHIHLFVHIRRQYTYTTTAGLTTETTSRIPETYEDIGQLFCEEPKATNKYKKPSGRSRHQVTIITTFLLDY